MLKIFFYKEKNVEVAADLVNVIADVSKQYVRTKNIVHNTVHTYTVLVQ